MSTCFYRVFPPNYSKSRFKPFKNYTPVCIFIIAANPMKYYNKVFDIFLYEGVYIFLFSWLLLLINDRYTEVFFKVSVSSIVIAGVLAVFGRLFNLFAKEDLYEEK